MVRAAARKANEQEQAAAGQEAESGQSYTFEPLTDELRSRLNVWGNSTLMLLSQIEKDYPGWHGMISDLFAIVKGTVETVDG